ncbi:MAG: hypothetical protein L3J79_08450 [Candidatus Marinimicrobia bacterium]|nr:hypothetical protein [Candidatus Neomarinimicrobiota bacterium]
MEAIVKGELDAYDINRLHKSQYGFIKGSSIEVCKYDLLQSVRTRTTKGEQTALLFVDLKSAYDRVDRVKLLRNMERESILSRKSMDLLRFLFTDTGTVLGEQLCMNSNGVPQGSTLSPMLFNIAIEPLARELEKQECEAYF